MKKFLSSVSIWSLIISVVLAGPVLADSTIGTNMSTTGTLTVTTGSATAIRFQNAAGTTLFQFDTSSTRFGIGDTAGTTFEVQGTASASYFLTGNSLQVAGFSSVAYSRFGTDATGHGLAATNDLLISGLFEVNKKAFFDATASAAYFLTANTIQVANPGATVSYSRFGTDATGHGLAASSDLLISGLTEFNKKAFFDATASAAYFLTANTIQVGNPGATVSYSRFGTAATTHAGSISTTNDLLISGDLEVNGSVAFDGFALFGGSASLTGNFELTAGTGALFGINAGGNINTMLEIGGTASISTVLAITNLVAGTNTASASATYVGEFVTNTATTSLMIAPSSTAATKGTCLKLKDTTGVVQYARINAAGAWVINTTSCK